jgi:hypothetical protein
MALRMTMKRQRKYPLLEAGHLFYAASELVHAEYPANGNRLK